MLDRTEAKALKPRSGVSGRFVVYTWEGQGAPYWLLDMTAAKVAVKVTVAGFRKKGEKEQWAFVQWSLVPADSDKLKADIERIWKSWKPTIELEASPF